MERVVDEPRGPSSTRRMRSTTLAVFLGWALGCGGGGTTGAGHPFACGDLMCNSATEICSIVAGHLPGEASTYACVASDGGPPSCGGPSSATMPGSCGCYASPNGEVTSTLCPP
jgi:hypothetical protein